MSECLPDLPATSASAAMNGKAPTTRTAPWRPIPAPQSGLPWKTDGPAVPESREPASVAPEASPTPADRMALAMCVAVLPGSTPCQSPCNACRVNSAAVAHEIARQLRQRHGGSSQVADWLDGVGCHPGTVQGTVLDAADDVPPVEQEITGDGSGASLPPFSNQPRVGEPLPLWLAMARAEAKVTGSQAFQANQFSTGCIQGWAPVLEALADWLLPDLSALPIDELAAAQQHLRHALRARLLAQAQVAREAGPH